MAKAIERRGVSDLAKRALKTTWQVFRYAIAHGFATRKRVTGLAGSAFLIPHFNKGIFRNVTGVSDPTGEFEKPHGQWNRLEFVSQGGHVRRYVNGKLGEGTDAR